MHPDYLDYIDSSSRMDYLAQLELDIKKEKIDLMSQLSRTRNILRLTQNLQLSCIASNPVRKKIKMPENHFLRSINLIVCGEDLENKLGQILTTYYFEIVCDSRIAPVAAASTSQRNSRSAIVAAWGFFRFDIGT